MFPVLLLSTILGVLFAFCGLMGGVAFFLEAQQGMSIGAFVSGFAAAVWPLLAAAVIFLLQGILKELTALREAEEDGEPATLKTVKKPSTAPLAPEETEDPAPTFAPAAAAPAKSAPVYFPVRETPQGPRIVRPDAENLEPPVTPPAPAEDGLTFFKTR